MKNLSTWAYVLIILATLMAGAAFYHFVVPMLAAKAKVPDTKDPALKNPVNKGDTVVENGGTLAKMRRG